MVGKDGYCPLGHLARPELQMPPPKAAARPSSDAPTAAPPPPVPAEPTAPGPAAYDPYTPPGLGPSNPPPQAAAPSTQMSTGQMGPGVFAPAPQGSTPSAGYPAPPPVPTEQVPAIGGKKSNKLTAFLVALGLAAIATLGFVAFGGSAGAANLTYVFTQGETHRYSMVMDMKISGGNLYGGGTFDGAIEMVMSQKVTKVDDAGVATIEYSFEKLKMTEGGRSRSVPVPSDVVTIEMTRDGRVISSSGNEFMGDINPAAGIFGPESFAPILPDHKVDPGDSWSLDGDAPNPFGEAFHIKGMGTLLSRSGTADQETAAIKTVISSPVDFRIELAKLAEVSDGGLPAGFPANAVMTFDGHLSMDLNQTMATKSGFLTSALGDMSMTGTFGLENVPQVGNVSGVLNMTVRLTMTSL